MVYGTTRALDRISLTVPEGQFVAVIGRSGAGKTTLLRCLSRAVVLSEGRDAIRGPRRDRAAEPGAPRPPGAGRGRRRRE
jgi:ABC-type phosphate/phosphonate transport system ATPase subunit